MLHRLVQGDHYLDQRARAKGKLRAAKVKLDKVTATQASFTRLQKAPFTWLDYRTAQAGANA